MPTAPPRLSAPTPGCPPLKPPALPNTPAPPSWPAAQPAWARAIDVMPIKLRNVNLFISENRGCRPSRLLHVGGIFRCHVRVMLAPYFGVSLPRTPSNPVFAFTPPRTSDERPQDCDQQAYDHYRQKNEV